MEDANFKMSLGMYDGGSYGELEGFARVIFLSAVGFLIAVCVFFPNLLVAQLICAYRDVCKDMVGFVRLSRVMAVMETMPRVRKASSR